LIDVLIAELAQALPRPLADRLAAGDCQGAIPDWLIDAAVYRSIAQDPSLARRFLLELESGPGKAGLALARAFAWTMEPPPRDAGWFRRDLLGMILQLGLAAAVLVTRCVLFLVMAALLGAETGWSLDSLPRGLLGLDLLASAREGGLFACAMLDLAVLWLGVEAVGVPRLLESMRQRPARRSGLPPPLAWRTDTFYVLWFLQAASLQVIFGIALGMALRRSAFTALPSLSCWTGLIGIALTGLVAFRLVLGMMWSTFRLGTGKLVQGPTRAAAMRCRLNQPTDQPIETPASRCDDREWSESAITRRRE
jgi:hypothetical protein